MGGSPCTHWSIAQTKNRETEPAGLGWELFKNYLIAKEKYKPDYFLYENSKSMAPAIREQITKELGVEPILINSAKVSAQNRSRLYWTNIPDVEQPEDRGILLRDILETGVAWRDKAYCLKAQYGHGVPDDDMLKRRQNTQVVEPVRIGTIESDTGHPEHDSQQYRVYSTDAKSVTLCGQGGGVGAKTGLYAVPLDCAAGRVVGRRVNTNGHRDDYNPNIERFQRFEVNSDQQKTNCISTVAKDNMVLVPAHIETAGNKNVEDVEMEIKMLDVRPKQIYVVRDGKITIKGKTYPINLRDGYYIIRKLTVLECMRLQTVPETYIFPVSDTQAYKMLGNGWTVDVTAHIMSYIPGVTTEPVEVLSMYDGMSCGHIALDRLGANVVNYYATEIDKYAIKTTMENYPNTIQLGDAFQVREDGWTLPAVRIIV